MDVLENVMLPAMAAGNVSRSRMRAKAMDLLKQVGLDDRATHTPLELSGGEQQQAALARALINDPGLILADEPTGNLDRNTGRQILDLLFGLSSQAGHTLVMVTHAPEIAAMCDRTLALENGVLVDTSAYTSTHES
jgi:predicted ABC-type transport system involved in lysophospholipase L1 biosynthesis ATPase subunit